MADPVLLLSKKDRWSMQAGACAGALFGDALIWEQGSVRDALPAGFSQPSYKAVISFLSPWIIPAEVLAKSAISINFHPGSCEYPGIGCYNFALYEEAKTFGATCHHMLAKVDSGAVIREDIFSLTQGSVETLKLRTMDIMLAMFRDITPLIASDSPLPTGSRAWTRKAFTRKELNALCELTPDMSVAEQQKRIRATTYPGYPGPYMLIEGKKHYYPVPPGPAIA